MKPEWWGSPLVQEKYLAEKAWTRDDDDDDDDGGGGGGGDNDNDNNNNNT